MAAPMTAGTRGSQNLRCLASRWTTKPCCSSGWQCVAQMKSTFTLPAYAPITSPRRILTPSSRGKRSAGRQDCVPPLCRLWTSRKGWVCLCVCVWALILGLTCVDFHVGTFSIIENYTQVFLNLSLTTNFPLNIIVLLSRITLNFLFLFLWPLIFRLT